ncbi:metalloregulator ArsR/SmtB family transcription factor [Actinoplanes sp. NPDC048796]|uniref:metalloregulator ArsR/SmtB family transcription factor n=1 Tax=unclassified Actinoplanes TaxID=2626549 RepID=UPI0033E870CF
MNDDVLERAVTVLRGMAYEHRLRILVLLRGGELGPPEIAAAVPADPTAVAHHLRFLLDARLIRRRRRGRQVYYALTDDATAHLVTEVVRYSGGER